MFKAITTKSRSNNNLVNKRAFNIALFVFFVCPFLQAHDGSVVEKLSVFGSHEKLPTQPGSAHLVSAEELSRFEYSDIHDVLRTVPGVNIQEEDGFGLRPNIGLRGGHPHRSKKVVLMEDGVLIGPAPYSAPAAYYFPQLDKMASIEVFKGTPSTRFGPNGIGGALNMVTRINEPVLKLQAQGGSFGAQKYGASIGIETFGDFSIDFSHFENQGFKKLLNKDNTGFVRENFRLRWDKYFGDLDQSITFKFNWSKEDSNETYTGLTAADFDKDPFQRYSGTELDKMLWNHRQFFLSHSMAPMDAVRVRTTIYRHEFDRAWNKLVGFGDGVTAAADLRDVMKQPSLAANNYYYQVLRGQSDSGVLSGSRDVLELGNNQRQYLSQGLQLNLDYELTGFSWDHLFQMSLRHHQDSVDRFHESSYYNMTSGQMVQNTSLATQTTLLNVGRAKANTMSLNYETGTDLVQLGLVGRFEDIDYELENLSTQALQTSGDEIFAPGLGVFVQAFEKTGFLFGVNKAFTPVGPGQLDSVRPEEAINYELGVRHTGVVGLELVGFYADYKNLLGTCTQSGGCQVGQLDQSFNGGAAKISGAEFLGKYDIKYKSITFPIQLTATYTKATFDNSFASTLNDWGVGGVNPGDPVPYIPEMQANLQVGLQWKKLKAYLNMNHLGEMADQAVASGREYIKARNVYGLAVHYSITSNAVAKLRADNLTNEEYAVSMRPVGLRPGRPQSFFVGFEYAFR